MAIMFNICALAEGWQQVLDADNRTIKPHSPAWQVSFASHIALKATSLALASTAYLLYMLSMTFHYNPRKGFAIPVLGWLVSAAIMFSLIGVEVQRYRKARTEQSIEYTKNFFAGILAAGLYCLIAILLATYTACASSLKLSLTDRRMIECTSIVYRVIAFAITLLGGAGMYSTVEGWSLIDSLYFTDTTVLTIGIGNISPQTHLGRSLLFPYATTGIINLGFVISSVSSFTDKMRDLKLRYQVNEARRVLRGEHDSERTANQIPTNGEKSQSSLPVPSKYPKQNEMLKLHKIKADFYRKNRWKELIFFAVSWFLLWLISAEVFRRSERHKDWTYFIALYFTYTSLTTIGYGDFFPTSNFGIVFFIFWSLLALPILTNLVTAMGGVLHRMLTFSSRYLWKNVFHKGHTHHHHSHHHPHYSSLEGGSQVLAQLHGNVPDSPPLHLEGQDHATTMKEYSRDPPSVGRRWKTVQATSTGSRATTQYRLRLAEEMNTLLSTLKSEYFENWEELCCTWSRVIPLLHAGENVASAPNEPIPFSMSAKSDHIALMKLMDPKKALSERNTEISWILALLVDKLCSDLREELSEAT
ncbi:potassium channel [Penicillium lagena]|uniref:potassium channel n=1 Tax=Penicillium lagena TaxID=94218 RepID=UPI00254069C2|nr:potassium channel [Penicillium lagena]KAJ5610866.1 potassium channel [Penicillium lagena]